MLNDYNHVNFKMNKKILNKAKQQKYKQENTYKDTSLYKHYKYLLQSKNNFLKNDLILQIHLFKTVDRRNILSLFRFCLTTKFMLFIAFVFTIIHFKIFSVQSIWEEEAFFLNSVNQKIMVTKIVIGSSQSHNKVRNRQLLLDTHEN